MIELTKKTWIEKGVIGLLVILNVMFFYYWLALAANYCLHFDDAHFMWKLRDYSIFEFVKEMYMTRGGNFVGYSFTGMVFKISNWIGEYHFWSILFYILGIIITWGAFRETKWIKDSGCKGWLWLVTLYNVYILTSVDYAVFTWICASTYYLFAPLVCLIIRYLYKESLQWRQWVILYISALFITGNSVSISTVTFMILFAFGMYMWHKEGWNVQNTWNKPQVRRLLMLTAIMLVCFAIVYVAPGNWSRMEGESDIEQPKSIAEFAKAIAICAGMYIYMMIFYLPYHLIAIAIGAWAGSKYPIVLPMGRNMAIGLTIFIFVVYLLVSVVPLAYLSNGFQIQRNYHPICFFYMLVFFAIGYIWLSGGNNPKFAKCVMPFVAFCALFMIVIMYLNIRQDIPVARTYNIAHQERESYMLELQTAGQKETVVVTPYPSTRTPDAKYTILKCFGKQTTMQAIYYESDTDMEPNEYEGHIRKLMKLDFDFVLVEPRK